MHEITDTGTMGTSACGLDLLEYFDDFGVFALVPLVNVATREYQGYDLRPFRLTEQCWCCGEFKELGCMMTVRSSIASQTNGLNNARGLV